MDETTISDIKQRVARWVKESKTNPNTSERNWIFAVNIDDVNLLLKAIAVLEIEARDKERYISYLEGRLWNDGKSFLEFKEWKQHE